MLSPIYWSTTLYSFAIRILYNKNFKDRYRDLYSKIPTNCSIVELCMGDAYLYKNFLKDTCASYHGLDNNKNFVNHAHKCGINARQLDVNKLDFPSAEILLMQGSLYHFHPNEKELIATMIKASKKLVIIAEPIKNLSTSKWNWIARISQLFSNARHSDKAFRFNEESLRQLFIDFEELQSISFITGGREMIGVFKGGTSDF